jgi:hypothetical protein
MAPRTAFQTLWRTTRERLANFNRRLAEGGNPDDMIFQAPAIRSLERDAERRIVEARKSHEPKRPAADTLANSGRPST